MPKVRVSAVRFRSLLANRHLTPSDIAVRAKTHVSPEELANSDLDVEFGREWVAKMLARLERSEKRRRPNDAGLMRRACTLNERYLDGVEPSPEELSAFLTAPIMSLINQRAIASAISW